jgi:hypothetical protein
MALPLLNVATYDLKLPSSGKKIQYRPFLVKEEKVLLQAMEGQDEKEILRALKQLITQCVSTEGFKVDDIAMVDLEYIFLRMRSKAVGDKSTINFTHKPGECDGVIKVEIDLTKVEPTKNKNESDLIKITDEVQVRMVPPTVKALSNIDGSKSQIDSAFDTIRDCITEIYSNDELFSVQDHTTAEVDDFINSLSSNQFSKLRDYFDNLPALKHDIEYTCPKCNEIETQTIQGVASFFG